MVLTYWGPRRNEQHFTDDIFKRIFFNKNVWILIKISLKFVPKGPINNIPSLVQIMAWRRSGDKPLSEPMMVSSPTHICVTRSQWVNRPQSVKIMWYAELICTKCLPQGMFFFQIKIVYTNNYSFINATIIKVCMFEAISVISFKLSV